LYFHTTPLHSELTELTSLQDAARKVLSYKAWAYYSSAGDDETSTPPSTYHLTAYIDEIPSVALAENARAFTRFFFNARVLRPISKCDTSTTILGYKSSIPIFVSGAALAKLGHPLGKQCKPVCRLC
jgi:L-lactate dehydrogenase (cytochrome)